MVDSDLALEPVAGKLVATLPWVLRPASYSGKSWHVGGSGRHAVAMPNHPVALSLPAVEVSPRVVVDSIRPSLLKRKQRLARRTAAVPKPLARHTHTHRLTEVMSSRVTHREPHVARPVCPMM